METQTPAPAAAPTPRKNLVIILVVVGVLVVAGIAIAAWRVSSDSSDEAGVPAGQSAKGLFTAWQDGNQTAAARVATPSSVTYIFGVEASEASGLEFDGCTPTGDDPFPKECVWSRPGGELTMTVQRQDGKPIVTKVDYGPAGLPPESDTSG